MNLDSIKRITIIILPLFLIGCALLYTTERYLFVYSHQKHLEMDLECSQCHTAAEKSESAANDILPEKVACAECHEVEDNKQCKSCHSAVDKAKKLEQRNLNLIFSHKMHAVDMDIKCENCHNKVDNSDKSTDKLIPEMEICEECHDTKSPNSNCDLCHKSLKDLYLKPDSHRNVNLFVVNHKNNVYTKSINYCQNCHKEDTCLSCHEGRIDRDVHNRNFRFHHSISARSNPQSCDLCHRKQFCKECH